jgi:hypothetical protein
VAVRVTDLEYAVECSGVVADVLNRYIGEVGLRFLDAGDPVDDELLGFIHQLRHSKTNSLPCIGVGVSGFCFGFWISAWQEGDNLCAFNMKSNDTLLVEMVYVSCFCGAFVDSPTCGRKPMERQKA